jgi:predicted phage gp36 major capsid-like protein
MTSGVSPQLAERLAQTQANLQAKSAQISDQMRARSKEIADEARRMREANEELCKQLDKRVEDRIAAKADPNSTNAWARPSRNRDVPAELGRLAEETEVAPEQAPIPELRTPARNSGRYAKGEAVVEEDDYANTDWLEG